MRAARQNRQWGRATPDPEESSASIWWLLVLLASVMGYAVWQQHLTRTEVSHESVGKVVALQSGGGWVAGWIQTESGYFPIRESVQVVPGTPLDLVVTGNDRRRLCTVDRKVCVRTTGSALGR